MGCTSFQEGWYSNAEAIISLVYTPLKGVAFDPLGRTLGQVLNTLSKRGLDLRMPFGDAMFFTFVRSETIHCDLK